MNLDDLQDLMKVYRKERGQEEFDRMDTYNREFCEWLEERLRRNNK